MADIFRATKTIVQEMCDDWKSITGITLTPDQTDNTIVVKFYSIAGAISSFYSEAQRTLNDIFPASASDEALIKHLSTRSLPTQILPQPSHGQIQFTFTGAASISLGTQVKRKSDGALFKAIQADSRSTAGTLTLFFESLETGNLQNQADINQPFELATPLANVNTACVNTSSFLDGRDLETSAEMLTRIITHDQDDNTGGNAAAYETWAQASSNEVVTAKCLRLVRGPDTVDVIITSGTTDIESTVDAGQTVSRLPSAALILTVQAYIENLNPVTDDVLVKAPTELSFNATIRFSLFDESVANRAYVGDLITKVAKTYIYQARPQDILSPTDLERAIDRKIGDSIKERSVDNFAAAVSKYVVPSANILSPGTITLVSIT